MIPKAEDYNPHGPDWHLEAPSDITLERYANAWIDMEPHVATLRAFASEPDVETIVEFGLRGAVSTWALLDGLREGGELIGVDINPRAPIPSRVRGDTRFRFVIGDSLEVPLPDRADLVMIDSSHEFTQTVRELHRASTLRPERILVHDYSYIHTPHVRAAVDGFVMKGYVEDPPYKLWHVEPSNWGLAILVPR